MKLLVVSDDPKLFQKIEGDLRSCDEDLEVLSAPSGEEGIAVLETEPDIDILLTDVSLPGIDGIEVIRRTSEKWPRIRTAAMTAFASSELKSLALDVGALRLLEKPLAPDALRELMHELAAADTGWSGEVHDLDIFDLTQLFLVTRKSNTVRVDSRDGSGILIFDAGTIAHASTPNAQGAAALHEMIGWDGGRFEQISNSDVDYPRNVTLPATQIMLEAACLCDEERAGTNLIDRFSARRAQPRSLQHTEALAGANEGDDSVRAGFSRPTEAIAGEHALDESHPFSDSKVEMKAQVGRATPVATDQSHRRAKSRDVDEVKYGADQPPLAVPQRLQETQSVDLSLSELAEFVRLVESARENLLMQDRAELDAWYYRHGPEETQRYSELTRRAFHRVYRRMETMGLSTTVQELQDLHSARARCELLAALLDKFSADIEQSVQDRSKRPESEVEDTDWSILCDDEGVS